MAIHTIKKELMESLITPCRFTLSVIPISWRNGGKLYKQTSYFLQNSQWWSEKRHHDNQLDELKRLLHHAHDHSPYYRHIFNTLGSLPDDIETFEDFRKFPFLTKDILRNNVDELKAPNIPAVQYITTGGSTGYPVGFYESVSERAQIEEAFIHSMWKRIGYKRGDRIAVLRGDAVPAKRNGSHWLFNPKSGQLHLSSYHLNEETAGKYTELINKFRINYLHVYPSAIFLFAKYLNGNESFPHLKGILCASEMLYEWQRKRITDTFGCRVFSHYGHTERAVLGGECEVSSKIHLYPEYGYTELIDEKGNVITEPGVPGEIVGTGFTAYATPFIRYRTGDMGILSADKCKCGRNYVLLDSVLGRMQDIIVTSKGRFIVADMVTASIHSALFNNVEKFQFYQDRKGYVTFKLVPRNDFAERDVRNISHELTTKLGNDMNLNIETVSAIPHTGRGKHRILIQKLDIDLERNS